MSFERSFMKGILMKKFMLLGVACLLAGCASLEKTSSRLDEKWLGKSYDEFVMEHGIAKTSQTLQNGSTMYMWEESKMVHKLGARQSVSAVCTLNILVNKNNTIQRIKASGSQEACYEIF